MRLSWAKAGNVTITRNSSEITYQQQPTAVILAATASKQQQRRQQRTTAANRAIATYQKRGKASNKRLISDQAWHNRVAKHSGEIMTINRYRMKNGSVSEWPPLINQ